MLEVHRIKKTKEIVFPIGKADNNHTLCLFRFKEKSRAGKYGVIQSVRDDNIVKDRENG